MYLMTTSTDGPNSNYSGVNRIKSKQKLVPNCNVHVTNPCSTFTCFVAVLPGRNDEVELDWAPKGQKDTIDKYLQTLPTEALPVKGSQAAHQRKQLLQKQIPIHDIDPSLCHELNEDEVAKMEEYIGHVKNSSVGVGQLVNLSNVINGK